MGDHNTSALLNELQIRINEAHYIKFPSKRHRAKRAKAFYDELAFFLVGSNTYYDGYPTGILRVCGIFLKAVEFEYFQTCLGPSERTDYTLAKMLNKVDTHIARKAVGASNDGRKRGVLANLRTANCCKLYAYLRTASENPKKSKWKSHDIFRMGRPYLGSVAFSRETRESLEVFKKLMKLYNETSDAIKDVGFLIPDTTRFGYTSNRTDDCGFGA